MSVLQGEEESLHNEYIIISPLLSSSLYFILSLSHCFIKGAPANQAEKRSIPSCLSLLFRWYVSLLRRLTTIALSLRGRKFSPLSLFLSNFLKRRRFCAFQTLLSLSFILIVCLSLSLPLPRLAF